MIKKAIENLYKQNESSLISDYTLLNFIREIILPNKDEIPVLFRYSKADYYNIRGLEKETLFLSPVGSMNDVFEGLSCKVDEVVLDKLDKLNDLAFMKSFSEEKKNLLMWAHYADQYAGMCVEYDFRHLSDEILYHLFPMVYSDKRVTNENLSKFTTDSLLELKKMNSENNYPSETVYIRDILSLFLVKPSCWSYEKEWRIIATYPQVFNTAEEIGDEEVKEFYNISNQKIDIPNCIRNVYLGPRMRKDIKDHIYEICKDKLHTINVYEMSLSPEKYDLDETIYEPTGND